ncbi:transposase [Phaeovulum sp.]|uniref:transposase n=1 Tax=Phaeovulum sp. TaxID=2934796 RepID=UPI0039E4AE4E
MEHQNEYRMEVRGSRGVSRIEVHDGPAGRRRWPDDIKARIVAESFQSGARVCDVAAKYGLIARQLSKRRGQVRKGELVVPIKAAPAFVPLMIERSVAATAAASADTGVIKIKICGAVLHVTPDCSPDRAAALVALRILRAALNALPRDNLTFIMSERGKPMSPEGFTNWFCKLVKAVVDDEGKRLLPNGLSPHGLRKATCRRLAEARCSAHEIMAISGHQTLGEGTRYTVAANRLHLAERAVAAMERKETRTKTEKPA